MNPGVLERHSLSSNSDNEEFEYLDLFLNGPLQGRDVKIIVNWGKYLKFEKILISREEQVPYLYDL